MPMHKIFKDGHCSGVKTTVQHSPEFWRMIDQLFALDALIDVRHPEDVTSETEFAVASVYAESSIADYAKSISPGSAGDLRNALYAHLGRIQYEAADMADVESIL